ncbi:MAG TPA: CvpA family protein [Myxococcota bacterium]|nr:CvpA family protein [Myxococcota bacterium]HOH76899.1 CvpA family protein [Myxococcota bacterium]
MIDYMAVGLVLFFGILGLVAGTLLQSLRLVASGVSIYVALKYSPVIADSVPVFAKSMMLREYGLPVMLFAVLYMLMILIIKVILNAASPAAARISVPSRLIGGILGAANGLLLAWFIVAVALAAQAGSGRKMVVMDAEKSVFVKFVQDHPVKGLTVRDPAQVEEMKVHIRQMADDAAREVQELTGKAMDQAGKLKETVGEGVGKATDKVEDAAGIVADKVEGAASDAGEKVEDAAGKVGDKVRNAADKAGDKVKDAADKVGDKVE